jgi:inactivated superfamily I helicase
MANPGKQTTLRTMITNTTPEADAVLLHLLRQAPVWRKLQLMSQLNDMARMLALSSLRSQYPQATESELQRLLAARLLGEELAASAYGPGPDLAEVGHAI